MLFKSLQITLHRKKSCSMLSKYSYDNIAQVKALYNVVQEAPDNIAHEKIPFNVVFALLGRHCTDKNPVQCCLNTLGTVMH